MPLAELPADPEPTDEEIRGFIELRGDSHGEMYAGFARMDWRQARETDDPNAFLVPFQGWVRAFPDGAPDYQTYCQSPRWLAIREKVLTAAHWKCACCRHRATVVHHRDYRPRVLLGDDLTPLVALCESCHHKVHPSLDHKYDESWQEAEATLAAMVAEEDLRLAREA